MYIRKAIVKRIYIVLYIGLIVNLLFQVARSFLLNDLAIDGKRLTRLQEQIAIEEEKRLILREELYKLSSLNRIRDRSEELGMIVLTGNNIRFYKYDK